jgi:spore coat protein U-like protein
MNPRLSVFVFGFLATGLAVRPALAATATASFTVSATVVAGCQATPATPEFKSYAAATANATSTISVTCTQPMPYVVSLGAATVPEESATTESATTAKVTGIGSASPAGAQPSLPQRAINRGRTTGAGTVAAAGSGSPQWRAAIEQAAAAEHLPPGVYPDSVMVSITY